LRRDNARALPQPLTIELIKQIRTRSKNKFVPILVLTTESQMTKKQEAKSAGATGWIVKPFKSEELVEVVGRVLQ
jgi:two-component system chemotaxis response regulator CheY